MLFIFSGIHRASKSQILIVRSDAYRVDCNRTVVISGYLSNLASVVASVEYASVNTTSRLGFKPDDDVCCVASAGTLCACFYHFQMARKWISAENMQF